MPSANKDSFISFFPSCTPYISFSCLMALASTFSMMLKRSGERGHPCLVPDLSGKAVSFSIRGIMDAVAILHLFFIKVRKFPSVPSLLSLYHECVLDFGKCLFYIY